MRRLLVTVVVLVLAAVPIAFATQVTLDSGGPVSGGTASDDATFKGASADGRTVAFTTIEALSPADGPNDTKADLYVRRGAATPQLLTGGTSPIASAEFDQVNVLANGDVLFTTYNHLDAGDADAELDAYLAKPDGTIQLVTGNRQNPSSTTGVAPLGFRASADGSAVAFSTTEDLLASDTQPSVPDVYRFAGGQLSLVTVGNAQGNPVALSQDGARVDWTSTAAQPGITDGDGGGNDVFYAEAPSFATVASPTAFNGQNATVIGLDQSPDGGTIVLDTNEKFSLDDTVGGSYDLYAFSGSSTPVLLTGGASSGTVPTLIRVCPGGTTLFLSSKRLLPGSDTDSADDIYRVGGGATTLMTPHPGPGTSDGGAQPVATSADCATVAWTTTSQETGADNDTLSDLYAATNGGTPQLVSALPAGATDGDSTAPVTPGTLGGALLFKTTAQLAAADTDAFADAYQWDRASNAVTLVSTQGSDQPYDQDLAAGSSDGATALVTTLAKLAGDTDTTTDVYRYTVVPDPPPSATPTPAGSATATPGPSATPTATPTATPPVTPTGTLTRTGKPKLERRKKRIALGRRARCSVACTATVTVRLGKHRLVRTTVAITANRTTTLRVRLGRKALRTLRRKRRLAFAITLKTGSTKLASASFKATVRPR